MTASEDASNKRKNMKVVLEDNSKVSKRDIYNRLCACRDFEIKLQWERAVFLTAFLIACFAGYGGFVQSVHQHGLGSLSPFVVSVIPIGISVVGIILSLFWIMMAKGSKAWYEHYESAIAAFSKAEGVSSDVDVGVLAHNWISLPHITRATMSDNIISLTGGCYSVSKIVIGIGILSLVIWSILLIVHVLICVLGPISTWRVSKNLWLALLPLAVVALAGVMVTRCVGSNYLKNIKNKVKEVK